MTYDVAIIIGTRPEAIKMFPVIHELRQREVPIRVISTGQQKHLLEMTLFSLGIQPDIELDLMVNEVTNTSMVESAVHNLTKLFRKESPRIVLVQGDTFSAMAGAISGYLNRIPVGHVEAGLRSHDLNSPWPEEGARRAIDAISTLLWVPTLEDLVLVAQDQRVSVTGNTIVDSLRMLLSSTQADSYDKPYILITLHRRESFGETLERALISIIELSETLELEFIFIQHPNPQVTKAVKNSGLEKSKVKIIEPVAYIDFLKILSNSVLLITDSGGLQEEASVLGKPMVILREKTERGNAIVDGISKLSHPDGSELKKDVSQLLEVTQLKNEMNFQIFGDGFASTRIVNDVQLFLKENNHEPNL